MTRRNRVDITAISVIGYIRKHRSLSYSSCDTVNRILLSFLILYSNIRLHTLSYSCYLSVAGETCILKPLKSFKLRNLFYITGVCTLHLSSKIVYLQASLQLLMKLLWFSPWIQFWGYGFVYASICFMVTGSSSNCVMCSSYGDEQCWSKHAVCIHQWYRRDFKV
jgi:hypothetical protein